jgi:hypothetical protein
MQKNITLISKKNRTFINNQLKKINGLAKPI